MSYLSKHMNRRARRRGRGMGDWVDDWLSNWNSMFGADAKTTADQQCLNAANAKSAALLERASMLSKTWNPTGMYSIDQFQSLIQNTLSMLSQSSGVIDKAMSEPSAQGSRDALQLKRDAIQRKMSTEGTVFINALRTATSSSVTTIDAPGLKSWIVNSMIVAADGITGAYYVSCTTPWFVGALAAFQAAFDKVWSVATQVAGVAAELGSQILKIPDTLSNIWTYATYGAMALIALWAYEQYEAHGKGA